jgi:hypothetical protein
MTDGIRTNAARGRMNNPSAAAVGAMTDGLGGGKIL